MTRFFHRIKFFGWWVRIFFHEKIEKMENVLPNHLSPFLTYRKCSSSFNHFKLFISNTPLKPFSVENKNLEGREVVFGFHGRGKNKVSCTVGMDSLKKICNRTPLKMENTESYPFSWKRYPINRTLSLCLNLKRYRRKERE